MSYQCRRLFQTCHAATASRRNGTTVTVPVMMRSRVSCRTGSMSSGPGPSAGASGRRSVVAAMAPPFGVLVTNRGRVYARTRPCALWAGRNVRSPRRSRQRKRVDIPSQLRRRGALSVRCRSPWMTPPSVDPAPTRLQTPDDHDIVPTGLGRLLDAAPDVEVVALAADGAEAVALTERHAPDVVLMDLEMPGIDGVEATRRIVRGDGAPSVVVLTSFSDRERITEALDSGAVGYLLKEAEAAEVVAGVRAAARGASPIDSRVAMTLVQERRSTATADGLTDREREVLRLVGAGVANKQIALRLGISPKTVKSHMTHIFRRIGVADRFEAAMWARRHGLVEQDGKGDRRDRS